MHVDFVLDTTTSISALNLFDRKTLAYSRSADNVMFRILKMTEYEDEHGTNQRWD